MKITAISKLTFLGLLLILNVSALNAYSSDDHDHDCNHDDYHDNDRTTIDTTNQTETTISDNTTIITDTAVSTPQCQQYGAFGECLY